MIRFTQPVLVPLKKPYPLLFNDGDIYPQMAALLLQNEEKEIISYPVLEMDYLADGQVFTDYDKEELHPYETLFKIGCNKGDRISWVQFIDIVRQIFKRSGQCDIKDIYFSLKNYDVIICKDDNPTGFDVTNKHLNVFINSFDNGINYTYGSTMAFNWRKEDTCSPEEKYEFFIEQIVDHMDLVPFYELHLLYVKTDKEFLDKYQKLENDIKVYIKEREEKYKLTPPYNQILHGIDYIEIAEYIQRTNDDDVLTNIIEKFNIDPSHKDHIWHFINQSFITTSKTKLIYNPQGANKTVKCDFQKNSLLENDKP